MKFRFSIGLLLLILGFAIPFVLKSIFPTFLYAFVISISCFWVGFIFLLQPIEQNKTYNSHIKWARCAIIANIILTISLVGYFYLIFYLDIHKGIAISIWRLFAFIAKPVQSIFDRIIPPPMVQLPDGSVQITNSFIRGLLTDFFDLLFYALSGIVLKTIKDKKITTVFSRARRPCAR